MHTSSFSAEHRLAPGATLSPSVTNYFLRASICAGTYCDHPDNTLNSLSEICGPSYAQ